MLDILEIVTIKDLPHVKLSSETYRPCQVIADQDDWVVIDIEDRGGLQDQNFRFRTNRFFFKKGKPGWYLITDCLWFKIINSDYFVHAVSQNHVYVNGCQLPILGNLDSVQEQLSTLDGVIRAIAACRDYGFDLYKYFGN